MLSRFFSFYFPYFVVLGFEKYNQIRNDTCLCFYNKVGPVIINEKGPETPDSINNPTSVEAVEKFVLFD